LPAAGFSDRLAAPDSSGAIEIEEGAASGASAMLDDKVAIEQYGFDLCEQRVVAVEIGPASLHHADRRILEVRNRAAEEIGFGEKVSVEDTNEFAPRGLKAILQCTGLEAGTIGAVDVLDWQTLRGETLDAIAGHLLRLVGGVVQNLNVQQLARIVETRDGFDEAFDHVALIENRELNGDAR